MATDKEQTGLVAVHHHQVPGEAPVLVTTEVVIYPHTVTPLVIQDERAVRSVDTAVKAGHKVVAIFGRKSKGEESEAQLEDGAEALGSDFRQEDLYTVGTAVQVVRTLRLQDGRMQVLVSGIDRVGLQELVQTSPYPLARMKVLGTRGEPTPELEALSRNVTGLFERALSLATNVSKEITEVLGTLPSLEQKIDFIASQVNLSFEERQAVLGELDLRKRVEIVNRLLVREVEILDLRKKIHSETAGSMDKAQREYYLRQQLDAIRKELGEAEDTGVATEDLREKIKQAGMPDEVLKEAERELSRTEKIPQASPEHSVARTYLDWLVDLPWSKSTEDHIDVNEAERILDEDHYGLEKPKERILEYLAVRHLKKDMKGPILCLVGPPGTGKTSLGRSVARALGREFVRMSLGGVRDEAEIRGHRRTYVGALPGRVIQGLRRAGTNNPVFMLDEIDKMGADFRGDPSSALLEVLDPAQNNTFTDHYLDVPFDLSGVLFIATANSLHTIPPALLDRMEVLELSGYTEAEKLEIARRYLVPRQLTEHGLTVKKLQFEDDAIWAAISHYTREAGLRNLEREIGSLCRKVARKFAQGRRRKVHIRGKDLADYLGSPRFRHEVAEEADEVGVATGLAWTPAGGEVLFVEASTVPGRGGLNLTGQVGDVMKESAQAAMTYIRSRHDELGLPENFNQRRDVHVHVPAGAVPKDGPSAGITMATVLASVFTGRPVRKDVAMTGEITLRGKVLPIGGVRDKVLAAHRAGIKTVILPEDNRRDLDEIPDTVRKDLVIVFLKHMDQVLDRALFKRSRNGGNGRHARKNGQAAEPRRRSPASKRH